MKRNLYIIATLAVVGLTILFFRYRWHKLEHYLPQNKISFAAPSRTMAEHNEFMQDKDWPYILWNERFAHLGPWPKLPPEAVHPRENATVSRPSRSLRTRFETVTPQRLSLI